MFRVIKELKITNENRSQAKLFLASVSPKEIEDEIWNCEMWDRIAKVFIVTVKSEKFPENKSYDKEIILVVLQKEKDTLKLYVYDKEKVIAKKIVPSGEIKMDYQNFPYFSASSYGEEPYQLDNYIHTVILEKEDKSLAFNLLDLTLITKTQDTASFFNLDMLEHSLSEAEKVVMNRN